MKNARECTSCGYLVIHPLIYCPKCPGRIFPVIISKEEYFERMAEFKRLEDLENNPHGPNKER